MLHSEKFNLDEHINAKKPHQWSGRVFYTDPDRVSLYPLPTRNVRLSRYTGCHLRNTIDRNAFAHTNLQPNANDDVRCIDAFVSVQPHRMIGTLPERRGVTDLNWCQVSVCQVDGHKVRWRLPIWRRTAVFIVRLPTDWKADYFPFRLPGLNPFQIEWSSLPQSTPNRRRQVHGSSSLRRNTYISPRIRIAGKNWQVLRSRTVN